MSLRGSSALAAPEAQLRPGLVTCAEHLCASSEWALGMGTGQAGSLPAQRLQCLEKEVVCSAPEGSGQGLNFDLGSIDV